MFGPLKSRLITLGRPVKYQGYTLQGRACLANKKMDDGTVIPLNFRDDLIPYSLTKGDRIALAILSDVVRDDFLAMVFHGLFCKHLHLSGLNGPWQRKASNLSKWVERETKAISRKFTLKSPVWNRLVELHEQLPQRWPAPPRWMMPCYQPSRRRFYKDEQTGVTYICETSKRLSADDWRALISVAPKPIFQISEVPYEVTQN